MTDIILVVVISRMSRAAEIRKTEATIRLGIMKRVAPARSAVISSDQRCGSLLSPRLVTLRAWDIPTWLSHASERTPDTARKPARLRDRMLSRNMRQPYYGADKRVKHHPRVWRANGDAGN